MIWLGVLVAGLSAVSVLSKLRPQMPEVTLSLADPTHPALLVVNDSRFEAEEIGYGVALYNVDNLREGYRMLPIEDRGLARLPPHRSYGPIKLFDEPEVRAWLKPGHRIVGSIAVDCPSCARGHTYWVFITWGEGGWFSDLKDMTDGGTIVPGDPDSDPLRDEALKDELLQKTAEVAAEDRVAIAPLAPSARTLPPAANAPSHSG